LRQITTYKVNKISTMPQTFTHIFMLMFFLSAKIKVIQNLFHNGMLCSNKNEGSTETYMNLANAMLSEKKSHKRRKVVL
jgi:hypothetical protein